MKQLNSYIPEASRLENKTEDGARIFFEDLAVVDGATRRVLAHRGAAFEAEGIGCAALLDGALWEWVSGSLEGKKRLLLTAGEGSLLVFADLFRLTGLLVLAYLPASCEVILLVLDQMGKRDVVCPLTPRSRSAASEEAASLLERMRELLYYIDRTLCAKEAVSLWTSCVTVSSLAGCRLEQVAMPPSPPTIKPSDVARLHLFLLCSFLILRGKEGRIHAHSREDSELSVCQCRLELLEGRSPGHALLDGEEVPRTGGSVDGSFLSMPCFAGFDLRESEGRTALCAELPIASDSVDLRAHANLWIVRLTLERQSA